MLILISTRTIFFTFHTGCSPEEDTSSANSFSKPAWGGWSPFYKIILQKICCFTNNMASLKPYAWLVLLRQGPRLTLCTPKSPTSEAGKSRQFKLKQLSWISEYVLGVISNHNSGSNWKPVAFHQTWLRGYLACNIVNFEFRFCFPNILDARQKY